MTPPLPPELEEEVSTPQDAGDTTAAEVDRERVAHRAYELYMARGGGEGQALDDWLAAERELASGERRREGRESRADRSGEER